VSSSSWQADPSAATFTFKQRNFDPETRQARKVAGPGEDTVEKEVAGLAEEIVREDEARRAEELVSCGGEAEGRGGGGGEEGVESHARSTADPRTCSTSSRAGRTGTSSAI
jgi:hypothetical protein